MSEILSGGDSQELITGRVDFTYLKNLADEGSAEAQLSYDR
jgi:hypothetical protein